MIRRNLFRATLGGLLLPAVTERVRAYSFVGGWQRIGEAEVWISNRGVGSGERRVTVPLFEGEPLQWPELRPGENFGIAFSRYEPGCGPVPSRSIRIFASFPNAKVVT